MNYTDVAIYFGFPNTVYVPVNFVAGDTTKFRVAFDRYSPADGWTCTFYLKGIDQLTVVATPTADNSAFDITLAANQTSALRAGDYDYAYCMSLGNDRYTVKSGRVTVKANIGTATAGSLLSHAVKMLALIEAALEGKTQDDVLSLAYYGKSYVTIPPETLMKMRGFYQYEVYRLRNSSQVFGKTITTNHLPGY